MENNNKEEDRKYYVYVHIRLDNNTVFYVGKGHGKRAYKLSRGKGTHHDNIWKACGCKAVIIKDNLTESQAFRLESKMIEYYVHTLGYGINIKGYDNYDHALPHLTNCTWGGEGASGCKHSDESKRKSSESHKGKNSYASKTEEEMEIIANKKSNSMKGKNAGKNPFASKTEEEMEIIANKKSNSMKGKNKGKKRSEETKRKISKAKKGIIPCNIKKVVCITTGKIFDSITEASNYYNIVRTSIIYCCRGRYKSAGKLNGVRLQWKYAENDDNESKAV